MQFFLAMRTSTVAISLFAVICAAVIAVTQVSTKTTIEDNEREFRARALYEIVPRTEIDNDLLADTFELQVSNLGHAQPVTAYRARNNNAVKTVIIPVVAPDGYTGNIHMIVGINADASVAGVRVLAHKETPGLGDKIETKKSDWIFSFDGKSKTATNDKKWAVKKDGGEFDQFTGATITPRAVVNGVGRAIDYFKNHRTELLQVSDKEVAHHDVTQTNTEVTN